MADPTADCIRRPRTHTADPHRTCVPLNMQRRSGHPVGLLRPVAMLMTSEATNAQFQWLRADVTEAIGTSSHAVPSEQLPVLGDARMQKKCVRHIPFG